MIPDWGLSIFIEFKASCISSFVPDGLLFRTCVSVLLTILMLDTLLYMSMKLYPAFYFSFCTFTALFVFSEYTLNISTLRSLFGVSLFIGASYFVDRWLLTGSTMISSLGNSSSESVISSENASYSITFPLLLVSMER